MSQPPKKLHFYYERREFFTTVLCQPFAEQWVGGRGTGEPQTTPDPAQVTCKRCLHKMPWVERAQAGQDRGPRNLKEHR